MAGNMGKFSKDLGVLFIWNFFGNNHGKNPCDSEFAVLKTKLDRSLLGRILRFDDIKGIYKWCVSNLTHEKWKIKSGSQITARTYHYVSKDGKPESFVKYKTLEDTKLYRCVAWDENGLFYRRHLSCPCVNCVKPDFSIRCDENDLIGNWESMKPIPKSVLEDGEIDETMEVEDEEKENPEEDSDCVVVDNGGEYE